MTDPAATEPQSAPAIMRWTIAALLVSILGVVGSLWLSIGMGLKACPLCFYQRTFVMAVVGIFATGLMTSARTSSLLHVLALPAAVGGLGVALFHVWLELSGRLECPDGVLGLGTAPKQSLAIFVLLLIPLAAVAVAHRRNSGFGFPAIVTAVVLGALLSVSAIKSSPPLPPPPDQPYDAPPIVCRPPHHL